MGSRSFFFFPGVSMVQFDPPCRAHVGQRAQFLKWIRSLLGLLGQGSTVLLLLDNSVAVLMVISTVDKTYLGQMRSPVSLASFLVQGFPSGNLLWVGAGGLARGGLAFFWAARGSRFRSKISSWCFWYHSRLRALWASNIFLLLGISNTSDFCLGRLTLSIVQTTNHRSRSRPGVGRRSQYPWAVGPPLIFLLSIKPLT